MWKVKAAAATEIKVQESLLRGEEEVEEEVVMCGERSQQVAAIHDQDHHHHHQRIHPRGPIPNWQGCR